MAGGDIRIGVSGWRYKPWRGVFYPQGLPQHAELAYASRQFSSIEINGSFYSLQTPASYRAWYEQTPATFVFAVKGGRYITHMRKLRDVASPLANFFASGLFNLREKLGPVLWQLPPSSKFDPDRLRNFFALLPRSTGDALRLARRRDPRMKGRACLAIDADRPLRHAIEVRHESFAHPQFIELLRKHGIALVVAETAGRWPLLMDVTADFVYLRLHGDTTLYQSGYGNDALQRWADRIAAWRAGRQAVDARLLAPPLNIRGRRDIYCYFDNTDVKLRAPADARTLMRMLDRPGDWELAG